MLLAASDLEEATFAAMHFLAHEEGEKVDKADGWPSVNILSYIQVPLQLLYK